MGPVSFTYDGLGRRQRYRGQVTHWVWDGDNPLHEWQELEVGPGAGSASEVLTWLFEEASFAPAAKLTAQGAYSVVTDHLGTPLELYDQTGQKTWQAQLDSYGIVKQGRGKPQDCPFRYQGQYEDTETGLYYNRFRYYDPEVSSYISQDPIGLHGGTALYAYVANTSARIDPLGLFDLYRSMSRAEYHDIRTQGWKPGGGSMEGKWFAESYETAHTWGQTMKHGTDAKFYVVKIHVPDYVAEAAFKHANLDGIGDARYLEVDVLNQHATLTEVHAVRPRSIMQPAVCP